MRVAVPVNATAKFGVPTLGRQSARILEGGKIVWEKNAPGKLPKGIIMRARRRMGNGSFLAQLREPIVFR